MPSLQSPETAVAATAALAGVRADWATQFLSESVKPDNQKNSLVRSTAVLALSKRTGSPDAGAALAEAASDPDPEVRATAALAIARFGDPAHVEILKRLAATDESPGVREEASQALRMTYQSKK